MRILLLAAILPAIFLIHKVYQLDRIEKEPPRLLVRLVFAALLSAGLAILLESVGGVFLPSFLPEGTIAYTAAYYFLVVGVSEELAKYLVLRSCTWKSPEFNCRFDGVVYAVTASLGFALWENIGYVFQFGLQTALVRAFTAVPGHACFGVFMGVYYGAAKHCARVGGSKMKSLLFRAVFVPMLLHGTYDTIASLEGERFVIAFVIYIAILFFLSWRVAKRAAREDLYFG